MPLRMHTLLADAVWAMACLAILFLCFYVPPSVPLVTVTLMGMFAGVQRRHFRAVFALGSVLLMMAWFAFVYFTLFHGGFLEDF